MMTKPTASPFLPQADWDELLDFIANRHVIPVIGPELVTVEDESKGRIPLTKWLAPRLGEYLQLPDSRHFNNLNEVACAFLLGGGDRLKIYSGVRRLMSDTHFEPSPALLSLAEIIDFDLFISTTFDPLLTAALLKKRPGFDPQTDVRAYDCKAGSNSTLASRFPSAVPASFIFHLLGTYSTQPDYAVWEEDYMEYLCCLLEQSTEETLKPLFDQYLRKKHLLLLGAPFSDWIVRFFLRTARGRRLTDQRPNNAREIISDHHESIGAPSVFFFNHIAKATRVVEGNPASFVAELASRWRKRRDCTGSSDDFFSHLATEMPRGAVFLSYSHDDKAAAVKLAMSLSAGNVPVWLDQERLRAGVNYERSLEYAIREGCSFFISLITRATEGDGSRYVHKERAWAASRFQDGFIFYIPVMLEIGLQPKLEPMCFSNVHREVIGSDGTPNASFIQRLRSFVESWRRSDRPRD